MLICETDFTGNTKRGAFVNFRECAATEENFWSPNLIFGWHPFESVARKKSNWWGACGYTHGGARLLAKVMKCAFIA